MKRWRKKRCLARGNGRCKSPGAGMCSGSFKEQEEGQCGWSRESEGQSGRHEGGGGEARSCLASLVSTVTRLGFILIATGSHRKVYKQGNDHYDLLLRKITQAAV